MADVIYSPEAEEDLLDIWSYIADDSEEAADKILTDLDAGCKMLSLHPEAGRERPELAPRLRSFPVGRYILFYRPAAEGV